MRTRSLADSYARIYAAVRRIPQGRVATYGQVAALAGMAGRARQVGYALHALPEASPLPWHRVINARGEVSPRAEPGIAGYQRFLLEEEEVDFDLAGRVDLERFGWLPGARPRRRQAPSLAGKRAAPALELTKAGGKPAAEVERIAAVLRPLGNAKRAAGEKAYLKSGLEFFGLDVPTLRREVRAWLRSHPGADRAALVALVRSLWRRPVHELRTFAIELLMARHALLAAGDLGLLERMLRGSRTWAYVDAIAVRIVGPLVERHPELASTLDRWSADPDFWLRRSALLALLGPLARDGDGTGDWQRWVRYADGMLDEREFFLRKAIGWVLREVGKRRPRRVADFLAPRLDRVAGLTLREAIKYLPDAERRRLLRPPGRRRG
jgi:alkylated DNA nucleotide flippase Atl1/3-methyladenine DNA glycosylase AlkD